MQRFLHLLHKFAVLFIGRGASNWVHDPVANRIQPVLVNFKTILVSGNRLWQAALEKTPSFPLCFTENDFFQADKVRVAVWVLRN